MCHFAASVISHQLRLLSSYLSFDLLIISITIRAGGYRGSAVPSFPLDRRRSLLEGFGVANKGVFTLCCGAHEYALRNSPGHDGILHYKLWSCCLCLFLYVFNCGNTQFFLGGAYKVIAGLTGHQQPAALKSRLKTLFFF